MCCAEKAAVFVQSPEVGCRIASRLENEILSVWCPLATALVGRITPTGKQRVKIAAVRGGLPDRAVIGLGIVHRKTQNRSVGRPADIASCSTRCQELVWIAAVALRQENLVAFAVRDPLPLRRPRPSVALKVSQSSRRTAHDRHAPQRAVERSPSRCIHQKRGTVWRNIENVGKAGVLQRIWYWKCLAASHGSLGKRRLPLDEVEPRTVRDHSRFRPICARELHSSQYPWRSHWPQRHVSKNHREGDERAARQYPGLPSRGWMPFTNHFKRSRYCGASPRMAQIQIPLQPLQVRPKLGGRLVTKPAIFLERLGQNIFQAQRQIRIQFPCRKSRRIQDAIKDQGNSRAAKWNHARGHLIKHNA